MEPLDDALGGVRQLRQSRRGLAGGQLLFCLAESILAGGSHLACLDPPRGDEAGRVPGAVAEVRAPETTARCRQGSTLQCPAVVAELARTGAELDRALGLPEWCLASLDLDSTATEAEGELKDRTPTTTRGSSGLAPCSAPGRSGGGCWPTVCGRGSRLTGRSPLGWFCRPCAPGARGMGRCGCGRTADPPAPGCSTGAGAAGCGSGWCPTTRSCGNCGGISCPLAGGQTGRWRGCGHLPLAGGTSGCGFCCGRYG